MPSFNDLINPAYQGTWTNAQACAEYDEWLDAEDARRAALKESRRIFKLYCRGQEEIELDPDYDDDF